MLRQSPVQCCAADKQPQQKRLTTMVALGPLFLAQIVGDQYFVPVYLPLLIFTSATEGRIDGPPAAAALAAATLLCLGGGSLTHAGGISITLIGANVVCAAFLLVESLVTTTEARNLDSAAGQPQQELKMKRGGDGLVRREDTALALILTLALAAFLTTTGDPVAGLRT